MEAASIGHAQEGARRVEAMVTRHGPALLRVANQFSLCHDDALDAYQRALEIFLRRLDRVDPATEGAWLRVVVKHEAMAIRRARQESVAHEDLDLDDTVSALRDVEEAVASGERVERSVEALRALKPDQAKALMLKAQGLSYHEIGRRFGWTYTKVNRSITEGRKRFMETFRGIEDGEACAGHAEALAALGDGTATSAQIVALRPHLRHCAACRAAVREMRFSRTRRIALLVPGVPWVLRRVAHAFTRAATSDVSQYAAATGGGRLGPAAALLGVCLGGAGAAVCATTGALPAAPPLISHVISRPAHHAAAPPRRHRTAARHAPAPTSTATVTAAVATATPLADHRAVTAPTPHATPVPHRHRQAAATRHAKEFGFEGSAATRTPVPTATPAGIHLASAGGTASSAPAPHPAAAAPASSEFGFEGGG